MSHLVSYRWFRRTQVIPEYVVFYNNVGDYTWRVPDCEELVVVTHRGLRGVLLKFEY